MCWPPIAHFFDLEGWEEPHLRERLPRVELRGTAERLEPASAKQAADAEVVSVFIHSAVSAESWLPCRGCAWSRPARPASTTSTYKRAAREG